MARQSRHIRDQTVFAHRQKLQQQQQRSRSAQTEANSGLLHHSFPSRNGLRIPTSDSSSDPRVPDDRLQTARNIVSRNPNYRQRMAVLCEMADTDMVEKQQRCVNSNDQSCATTTPTHTTSDGSPFTIAQLTPPTVRLTNSIRGVQRSSKDKIDVAANLQSNGLSAAAAHRYCERLRQVPHAEAMKPPLSAWRPDDGPVYARFVEDVSVIDHEVATLQHYNDAKPLKYPLGPMKINGSATSDPTIIEEFETPLFKGKIVIRMTGIPSSSKIDYFLHKKRRTQCIVQGQFKQKGVYLHEVFSGFENSKPWQSLPSKFMFSLGMGVVKKLIPVIVEDLTGDKPYFLTPLVSSCQTLHIANPLETDATKLQIAVPDILDPDIPEDTRLLGGKFVNDENLSRNAAARKRHFSTVSNLFDYSFDPDLVYTIDVYQHLMSFATYCYDVVVAQLDLRNYLNGQPIEHTTLYDPDLAKKFFGADENTNSSKGKLKLCGRHFWRVQFLHESLG